MSKAKLEKAVELVAKYELFRHDGKFNERVAALIDEARGVDAEPVGEVERGPLNGFGYATMVVTWKKCSENLPLGVLHKLYTHPAPSQPAALLRFNELMASHEEPPIERLRLFCSLAMNAQDWLDVEPFFDAVAQPAAMVNLAAETPTQKGARATLAVQGLSKAFDGLGSGRKDRKMKVTDEMVNRFLMWKLPAGFAPDCGISFKSESDYEHPVFGCSKHEPMGTNLFSADQARAMLEHVLADIQPAAPVTQTESIRWPTGAEVAAVIMGELGEPESAAPVELPVVGVISAYAIPTSDKPYADEILVQRSRQIEGPPLWAVRLNGDCLNKSGEWEWEPMPSSRDDEFLDRCRFPTAQEAIQAAIATGRKV